MTKHRINMNRSEVLYGRQAPLAELEEAFRWAALGSTELVLLSGSSGVGKSSLVLQAFQPKIADQCHFAWGKFDPYSSSKPYGALIACFQFLIRKLLTEPEDVLEQWKTRLKKAVGINSALVTEVIPEAKWLLGEQAPSQHLPAKAAHNRFEWVFRQFVQTFTSADRPLVLFLDDLQWADRATLQLIDTFITDPQSQYLCVIGSFRKPPWKENEDLLGEWLAATTESGYTMRHIQLEPLDMDDVHRLVCDVLEEQPDRCYALAHALLVKSVGNPLYVKQLLQAALDEKIVAYDEDEGRWIWNREKIDAFPSIEGQLEHLMGRITRLPAISKQTLILASILGNAFDLDMLSAVSQIDAGTLSSALESPIRAGLLAIEDRLAESETYRFTHDRIRQAAYEMMAEAERKQVHLRAALHLSQRQEPAADPALQLFQMTNHFNQAVMLLNEKQKEETIRLNHQAAQQAMQTSDYGTALNHIEHAIDLLPDTYWEQRQSFTYHLHLLDIECRYLCGQYEQAEQRVERLLPFAVSWLQRAQTIKLRIEHYSNIGKYEKAIGWGLSTLKEAGIYIDMYPAAKAVIQEIQETKKLLSERRAELYSVREIDDEQAAMRMELFVSLVGPAFFSNRGVLAVVSSQFIRSVFQYGATAIAPAVYAAFAMVLTTVVEDHVGGFELGKVAVELAARSKLPQASYATDVMFYTIVSSWVRVNPADEKRLWQASRLAVESGDNVYGSYAIGGVVNLAYGRCTMTEMRQIARRSLPAAEATKEELVLKNVLLYMQLADYMLSTDDRPLQLTAGFDNEEALLAHLEQDEGGAVTLYQIYTYKTQVSYLFGRYKEALHEARMAYPYEALSVQVPHRHIHHFYEALACFAIYHELKPEEQKDMLRLLEHRIQQFEKWTEVAPATFKHRLKVLQAQWAALHGKEMDAMQLYDEAIHDARQRQDFQFWAVACECAGRFHMNKNRLRIAEGYLKEAYEGYGKWEAQRKCASLQLEYQDFIVPPELRATELAASKEDSASLTVPSAEQVADVIKASFSLTQRFNLQEAYRSMTQLIFDQTNAVRGCLITCKEKQLRVELVMHSRSEVQLIAEPLEQSKYVPRSIAQYTARMGEPVELASAQHDALFRHDPYIIQHQSEAVCCLPVFVQEQLAGLLFLEIGANQGPLSKESIATLSMIAAQMLFLSRLVETVGAETDDGKQDAELNEMDTLTEREMEVLELMASGLTNKEIAIQLGITAGTVKVHTHNIFSKLNVDRRMKAIVEARKMNLLG